MESTIKLFRALPISTKKKKEATEELLKETIRRGFIFTPEVVYNYPNQGELIELVESVVGITGEKANSSFHKSWKKVKEANIEQLVLEQILHYFTTYGFEALGVYSKDSVYIPNEKLEIPEVEDINLVVIKGYSKPELKDKLLNLLDSGIALGEDTISDITDVALFVELNEDEIKNIKNREVKVALYDYLNLVPQNPVEFLRFVIFKSIDKTLLIKSSGVIEEIKEQKNLGIARLFLDYEKKYGLERLAEIFYRFKPIFLAFRTNRSLKKTTNKIRRLAVKHHKPLPEDYLNAITAKIKRGESIDREKLTEELGKVNTFRKIRLAYALKFRTKDVDSILYRIRNGKGYATEFDFPNKSKARKILDIVVSSITEDMGRNVKGKKIYIPEYVNYSLPATEKQFTGNFPAGTYVSIPKDMIAGVYWENTKNHSVDLDLSLIEPTVGKIGWDSAYRTEDRDVLFSGDITDAPKGATELFYVQKQTKKAFIVLVNYFNYDADEEVSFKIIVAKERVSNFRKNYMVDPNNIMAVVNSTINQKQKVLGLLVVTTNECRFYFTETYLGRSITSSGSKFVKNSRKYLFDFYENTINLKDILMCAGAEIVDDRRESDIDLSPEVLEKDSILNLVG